MGGDVNQSVREFCILIEQKHLIRLTGICDCLLPIVMYKLRFLYCRCKCLQPLIALRSTYRILRLGVRCVVCCLLQAIYIGGAILTGYHFQKAESRIGYVRSTWQSCRYRVLLNIGGLLEHQVLFSPYSSGYLTRTRKCTQRNKRLKWESAMCVMVLYELREVKDDQPLVNL